MSTPPNKICPPLVRAGGFCSPREREAQRGLARTRLAHEPDELAALQLEGDVVDGLQGSGIVRFVDDREVAHLEQRLGG